MPREHARFPCRPVALRRAMAAEGPFGETIKLVDSAVDQD